LDFWVFFKSCGFTFNINVKLHAISDGLDLVWTHDFKIIICKSDSLFALKFIKE